MSRTWKLTLGFTATWDGPTFEAQKKQIGGLDVTIASPEGAKCLRLNVEVDQVGDDPDDKLAREPVRPVLMRFITSHSVKRGIHIGDLRDDGFSAETPKVEGEGRHFHFGVVESLSMSGEYAVHYVSSPESASLAIDDAIASASEVDALWEEYRTALGESENTHRFLHLYRLLIGYARDGNGFLGRVDALIRKVDPSVVLSPTGLRGAMESDISRIGNELRHFDRNADSAELKKEVAHWLPQLQRIVQQVVIARPQFP